MSKKFRIIEEYSDLCFFRKITEIEAKNEKEAEELYHDGDEKCIVIMDEMFKQKNDPFECDFEIEEMK